MAKVKYTNENIINIVSDIFTLDSIMFMYYSGSINYGFNDEESDFDVTAVVNGFKGSVRIDLTNLDLLVYGADCYLDRFKLKEEVPIYQIVKMDDLLLLDKNIIYLNPAFKSEFNEYRSLKFDLKNYLDSFIKFQEIRRLNYYVPDKSMYHILRIKGMLEHYERVGIYEMKVDEPWFSSMLDFKKNYANNIGVTYLPKIIEALEYIKLYRKRM